MKATRKTLLALIGAMAMTATVAAPSVEIVSVQQQYPWTNTVDIVYNVAGVASDTNGYFVAFTPTTQAGQPIEDINGETSIQVALTCTTNGAVAQWFPQTNQQYTACKMTPAVYRGGSGGGNDYMIVDLETGAVTYEPMATQEASNERYNTQEYKTKKLVLRRIDSGTYRIGHKNQDNNTPHDVKVPDGTCYYIGVFELTRAQYRRIMGTDPSSLDTYPMASVSWNTLRNSALPNARVVPNAASQTSFFARLSGLTGLYFDLPTEEMWEIAARASSTTVYYWGDTVDSSTKYCWYTGNSNRKLHPVGTALPNNWGLYDVCGNVAEMCLDVGVGTDNADLKDKKTNIYTVRTTGNTGNRMRKGGETTYTEAIEISRRNAGSVVNGAYDDYGFRVAIIFQ